MKRETRKSRRAGTQAEATSHLVPAAPARDPDSSQGAPPSNTAPANCIDGHHHVLRNGVDSLYLSFKGDLSEEVEQQLIELKTFAQSDNPEEVASAVIDIEDRQFKVLGRGTKNFPFIIRDGAFNIKLSKATSETLPLAHIQISSLCLTESGYIQPVRELKKILLHLGAVGEIKISRLDICCDFTTDVGIGELPQIGWVSRSNKRNIFIENGNFSGFVFGQGSRISARLYDKTLEITKSRKDYLKHIWWGAGWDMDCQVWRLEFQIMRPVLVELGMSSFDDMVGGLTALWKYATSNWLRLVCPGKDQTKSRWPSHPLWLDLQKADFGGWCDGLVTRQVSRRVPSNHYFFINGLAPITSYMAARGIETFEEARHKFLEDAKAFHAEQSLSTGEDIEAYCQKRAALKAREYNTRMGGGEDET